MVHLAKKAVEEARDAFLQRNVQQERAISNTGYTRLIEQNNSYIKKDEQTMDSAIALYKAHFHALALEHLNLKSQVESYISQDKARGKKKVEVTTVIAILQYLMIHLPERLRCFALPGARRYYLYATARF